MLIVKLVLRLGLLFTGIMLVLSAGMVIFGKAQADSWVMTYATRDDNGVWRVYLLDMQHTLTHYIRRDYLPDTRRARRSFPILSPTGRHIIESYSGDLTLYDLQNDRHYDLGSGSLPEWSPDGALLAYEDGQQVYIMPLREDGSPGEVFNVSAPLRQAGFNSLAWSPDGEHLVFDSFETYGNGGWMKFYIVARDGSNLRPLAVNTTRSNMTLRIDAAWSPDNQRLAVTLYQDDGLDVYTVRVDDDDTLTQVTDHTNGDVNPVWSPNGRHLAFMTNEGATPYNLYVMDTTTQTIHGPLDYALASRSPDSLQWSPDGRSLAYISWEDGQIYRINADGSGRSRVTTDINIHYRTWLLPSNSG